MAMSKSIFQYISEEWHTILSMMHSVNITYQLEQAAERWEDGKGNKLTCNDKEIPSLLSIP